MCKETKRMEKRERDRERERYRCKSIKEGDTLGELPFGGILRDVLVSLLDGAVLGRFRDSSMRVRVCVCMCVCMYVSKIVCV